MTASHSPATNRLAAETSPYLLQHAGNPVDWYPWGAEALSRAMAEDRPILLSIGYSACHWCHVMAHESFEDPTTAEVMNSLFVNIKLDREERPDLDKVYQIAHQVLTQRGGGWPLTMFLTPDDLTPFFAGTYFPREPRYGMPGFVDVLQRVAAYYRDHRDDIRRQNGSLREVFADLVPPAGGDEPLSRAPIDAARSELESSFDDKFGGFGGAPKFPHPASIERLLRDWQATASETEPDLKALYMASLTLKRMSEGGLYDQLGGGFCRYSVDPYWMIPHFEKMLYDNGPLLALTAQAAIATGDGFFRRVAVETAEWSIREMRAPEGGFHSALDADSEGHEGRFYVWDREEVRALLTAGEYAAFARRYGLDREANFEGSWHLHCFVSVEAVAGELGLTPAAVAEVIDAARAKLLAVRNRRIWPARDDKVLTAWNGLMIRGLAVASRALDRPDFAAAASGAVDFLRSRCVQDGQLYAAWKDGRARFPAYLDDHAFLLDGILELLQTRWRSEDLDFARLLADALLERFQDRERGGFWFTAEGQDPPLYRPKGFADEATPSGNGVAAFALARLGWLLGETRYLDAAERSLRGGWASIRRSPQAHTMMLTALEEHLSPPQVVILRGAAADLPAWSASLAMLYAPRRLVFAIPAEEPALPEALAGKRPRASTVAYVCEGPQCSEPIDELPRLLRLLRDGILTRAR
ncbi:MAG TPA: thioredoxin domain-containing protein [Steroidobacteraceae bacterium]|nr:thioredoxin domain-containing protein [Steroidobacteraceae bacterium]